MKSVLFFDYDGVIVDSLSSVAKIQNIILKRFNKNIQTTPELIRNNWNNGWQGLYLNIYGFRPEELPETAPLYKKLAVKEKYLPKIFYGIDVIIRELAKTHKLYIVSANYHDVISGGLARNNLLPYFSKIFTQDDVKEIHKSDPKFFLHPLEATGHKKEEVLIIGDTADEVYAGKSAGIKTIACSWGWQLRNVLVDAGPDYLVDTPEELLKTIQDL